MSLLSVLAAGLLSAMTFEARDIEGISATLGYGLLGQPLCNFRHADLDGDGVVDLVFAGGYIPGAALTESSRRLIPDLEGAYAADLWKDTFWALQPEKLIRLRWRENDWSRTTYELRGIPASAILPLLEGVESNAGRLSRFMHDADGDGEPELVLLGEEGGYVAKRKKGDPPVYACDHPLDILPPARLITASTAPLWPESERYLGMPPAALSCRVLLESGWMRVLTPEPCPPDQQLFKITSWPLDDGEATHAVTRLMPAHFEPCRLNPDDQMDFAGLRYDWQDVTTGLPSPPILEVTVTLDAGASFATFRSASFRPRRLFVDYNGDGFLDLVLERTGLFRSGVRESLARFITDKKIEHKVAIHLQNPLGGFEKTPSVHGSFVIEFDTPPLSSPVHFERYRASELTDFTGDFNGDGVGDAVLRDHPDRLAIHFGAKDGFPNKPSAILPLPGDWSFTVVDVDGDHASDIIVRWPAPGTPLLEKTRVYLARGGQP